jgi:predicted XRE-type DNA-binding protein
LERADDRVIAVVEVMQVKVSDLFDGKTHKEVLGRGGKGRNHTY